MQAHNDGCTVSGWEVMEAVKRLNENDLRGRPRDNWLGVQYAAKMERRLRVMSERGEGSESGMLDSCICTEGSDRSVN